MHTTIIDHFNGHFKLSECKSKLIDVFCKSEITELSIEALEMHIESDQHKKALKLFLIKDKLKGRAKKVAAELDELASELEEKSNDQEEDISDALIDSFIEMKSLPDKVL